MNLLYCALDSNEFNRISTYESANDIWNRLKVAHKGTSQVKESKIDMLVHSYEIFKMNKDENITQIFTHFTNIFNALKSLGKSFPNSKQGRKDS